MTEKSTFHGVERLYGQTSLDKLAASNVMVVGLGGVGSWAAEALARSGVGGLILVDLDDICVSNINRQIHATQNTIGSLKVREMEKRIHSINPNARVNCVEDFFSQSTYEEILSLPCDYIIDAIDGVKSKCLLISECKKRDIPLIVTGGAGGKINPNQIQEADLNRSFNCRLLSQVRKKLKTEFGFSRDKKRTYKIPCVFSPEPQIQPELESCERGHIKKLNCQNGFGSSVFVTGTFGFVAAAKVVNELIQERV